jgi:hypothetical protein
MNLRVVACSKCQTALTSPTFYNADGLVPCPSCGSQLQVQLFPAFFREEVRGSKAENVLIEGESSCFYHPQKKAVLPCDGCGRFLCALCDVELNGQHLCPTCLERGQQKGTLKSLENHRVRYDGVALLIALAPLLIWPLTLITGPGAVFFAVRHWRTPTSIVRRTKVRYVMAIVIGLAETGAWVVGLAYALRR